MIPFDGTTTTTDFTLNTTKWPFYGSVQCKLTRKTRKPLTYLSAKSLFVLHFCIRLFSFACFSCRLDCWLKSPSIGMRSRYGQRTKNATMQRWFYLENNDPNFSSDPIQSLITHNLVTRHFLMLPGRSYVRLLRVRCVKTWMLNALLRSCAFQMNIGTLVKCFSAVEYRRCLAISCCLLWTLETRGMVKSVSVVGLRCHYRLRGNGGKIEGDFGFQSHLTCNMNAFL